MFVQSKSQLNRKDFDVCSRQGRAMKQMLLTSGNRPFTLHGRRCTITFSPLKVQLLRGTCVQYCEKVGFLLTVLTAVLLCACFHPQRSQSTAEFSHMVKLHSLDDVLRETRPGTKTMCSGEANDLAVRMGARCLRFVDLSVLPCETEVGRKCCP